jgi:hypothetical protein
MLAGVLNFTATSAGQPASTHTSTYSAWLDGFGFTAASIGNTGVRVNASGVNRISLTDSAANFTNCPVQIGGVTTIDASRNGSFASVTSAGNVSGVDLSITGWVYIDGTAVLKGQGAAVGAPSGGTTVDTECRAQLSSLLTQLRAMGLIA